MTEMGNEIILTDEEGQEHKFQVLDIMELDENQYAILLPAVEDADEAIILKFGTDENGEEVLCEIEEDDEWEMVAQAWQDAVSNENGDA